MTPSVQTAETRIRKVETHVVCTAPEPVWRRKTRGAVVTADGSGAINAPLCSGGALPAYRHSRGRARHDQSACVPAAGAYMKTIAKLQLLVALGASICGVQACGDEDQQLGKLGCTIGGPLSKWCSPDFVAERRSWRRAFDASGATCADRLEAARHMAALSSMAASSPYEPVEWWRVITSLAPLDENAWRMRADAARELGDRLSIGDKDAARREESLAWHVASLTARANAGAELSARELEQLAGGALDACR